MPLHLRASRRAGRPLAGVLLIGIRIGIAGYAAWTAVRPRSFAPVTTLPGPYAYDFSAKLTTEHLLSRDANGIIMVKYPSGLEYNPVTVAQLALAHYDRWLREKGTADREEFLKDAEWLVSTQKGDGLWYYDFPNGPMPVPWVSAMAQGPAMSVLVRAYALSGDAAYASAADRALDTYDLQSGKGGVSATDGGYVWYEETMPPYSPHILNGMVFAMYGALDMATILDDAHARHVFDVGVDTLVANIGKYDAGNWSYYNQATPPGLASRFYNNLHAQLLAELFTVTGREVFRAYSERFAAYASNPPAGVAK